MFGTKNSRIWPKFYKSIEAFSKHEQTEWTIRLLYFGPQYNLTRKYLTGTLKPYEITGHTAIR